MLAGIALFLVACNGDGSSSATTTTSTTLSGTAAVGAPIDGYVYVVDVNGTEVNAATNATTGAWTVSVNGMTAPFLIRVVQNYPLIGAFAWYGVTALLWFYVLTRVPRDTHYPLPALLEECLATINESGGAVDG